MKYITFFFITILIYACSQNTLTENDGIVVNNTEQKSNFTSFDVFIQIMDYLKDSGFYSLPQNKWSNWYEPAINENGQYKKEANIWYMCDTERNIYKDTLNTTEIYSCVLKNEITDCKISAFYYPRKKDLENDKQLFNYISKYILCTNGLKHPNKLFYIDKWAFIVQTRAVMYEESIFMIVKLIKKYNFNTSV